MRICSLKNLKAEDTDLDQYFLTKTRPITLFDLGGDVFDSATVDSNILLFAKLTKGVKS